MPQMPRPFPNGRNNSSSSGELPLVKHHIRRSIRPPRSPNRTTRTVQALLLNDGDNDITATPNDRPTSSYQNGTAGAPVFPKIT
jgi:hypothetical protein